jgi:hypothetical protein
MTTAIAERTALTCRLLHDLLTTRPDYVRLWQEQVQRQRSPGISPAGVARVLALYLWGAGERADTETTLARDLKDRVRRALVGQSLSPETLSWFVRAFDMSAADEHTLWATYASGVNNQIPGISKTIASLPSLARPQVHRTVALFERYTIDADHSFIERHTMHVIMALTDDVGTYVYNHDPAAEHIEVLHGGQVGTNFLYGDGLHGVELLLERNLSRGESLSIEYKCLYPKGIYDATEVRRPAYGRSQNVDIALRFHQSSAPKRLLWTVWDDQIHGHVVQEDQVHLNEHAMVHRFVPFIEETVVGFRWEW